MHLHQESFKTTRDKVFIGSSILFNILVSAVYVYSKLGQMTIVRIIGIPIIMLIIPFGYTLREFLKTKEKRMIFFNTVIILYLLLELLLDYILYVPFRENLVMHIPYILVF